LFAFLQQTESYEPYESMRLSCTSTSSSEEEFYKQNEGTLPLETAKKLFKTPSVSGDSENKHTNNLVKPMSEVSTRVI